VRCDRPEESGLRPVSPPSRRECWVEGEFRADATSSVSATLSTIRFKLVCPQRSNAALFRGPRLYERHRQGGRSGGSQKAKAPHPVRNTGLFAEIGAQKRQGIVKSWYSIEYQNGSDTAQLRDVLASFGLITYH